MSELWIDLAERWRRARRAALLGGDRPRDVADVQNEEDLIEVVLLADREGALRRTFENSLRLGTSFGRHFRREASLDELPHLLPQLGAPCLMGEYTPAEDEPAYFVARRACSSAARGPAACDFWSEAIEGLVLGLTGGLFYGRHNGGGHGGDRCHSVLYVSPESSLRFGAMPPQMQAAATRVARMVRAFHSSLEVVFLGVNDGVLHYEVRRSGCGDAPLETRSLVERGINRHLPGTRLREVMQRSVLSTDGQG